MTPRFSLAKMGWIFSHSNAIANTNSDRFWLLLFDFAVTGAKIWFMPRQETEPSQRLCTNGRRSCKVLMLALGRQQHLLGGKPPFCIQPRFDHRSLW
ncbi:MAG: hypothetical protein GY820_30095 [Gammaproteobacteria bacterium]|nr:hypothetical protein [Gammaproteobacteria bacterium]